MRHLSWCLFALAHGFVQGQYSGGSPYSAYGFGDLLYAATAPTAAMGGVGIAITEPYAVVSANPASFASARQPELGGLMRPVFDAGVRATWLHRRTAVGGLRRADGEFMGFNIGVPFGRGKWGLAFGLNPFSGVGYTLVDKEGQGGVAVQYEYDGSGGLNKVYAGVGRTLYQHKADTTGNLGARLTAGATFEFLFGGVEQTRKTIYPVGQSYTNTSAYSSLVLRAPTGTLGMQYSAQLVSKARVGAALDRRWSRWQQRLSTWRDAHPGSVHPRADRKKREPVPWRFTLGATVGLPTLFSATSTDLVTLFYRNAVGSELVIDTLPSAGTGSGTIALPPSLGVGLSIHDQRWMFTVEARRRDWGGLRLDLDGYVLPSGLRASTVLAAGARFTPAREGGLFERITYRTGLRFVDDYLEVRGEPLRTLAASAGVSIPLNWAQTNSLLHFGVESAHRGSTANGLIREDQVNVWFGVSITPWKLERWFRRYQIQ